jgi:hypothetical protein
VKNKNGDSYYLLQYSYEEAVRIMPVNPTVCFIVMINQRKSNWNWYKKEK